MVLSGAQHSSGPLLASSLFVVACLPPPRRLLPSGWLYGEPDLNAEKRGVAGWVQRTSSPFSSEERDRSVRVVARALLLLLRPAFLSSFGAPVEFDQQRADKKAV